MPNSTLTSKGQLTLPKAIRERLNVRPGDRVEFRVNRKGQVLVEAATVDLLTLRGRLKARRRLSVEEMDKAIRRAAARR